MSVKVARSRVRRCVFSSQDFDSVLVLPGSPCRAHGPRAPLSAGAPHPGPAPQSGGARGMGFPPPTSRSKGTLASLLLAPQLPPPLPGGSRVAFPAWGRGVAGRPLGCWGGTPGPGTRHAAGGSGPGSRWHLPGGAHVAPGVTARACVRGPRGMRELPRGAEGAWGPRVGSRRRRRSPTPSGPPSTSGPRAAAEFRAPCRGGGGRRCLQAGTLGG